MRETIRVSQDFVPRQTPLRRPSVPVTGKNWRSSVGLIAVTAIVSGSGTLLLEQAIRYWLSL